MSSCLEDKFAPFDIQITDVDPGACTHIEVLMVGGTEWESAGLPMNAGTVSPFSCSHISRAIVFVNTPLYSTDDVGLCEAVAQTVGSSQGIDHEFSCPDLMTFLSGCGPKTFTDSDQPCGEFEARNCSCGGATQNSYQLMVDAFGLAR